MLDRFCSVTEGVLEGRIVIRGGSFRDGAGASGMRRVGFRGHGHRVDRNDPSGPTAIDIEVCRHDFGRRGVTIKSVAQSPASRRLKKRRHPPGLQAGFLFAITSAERGWVNSVNFLPRRGRTLDIRVTTTGALTKCESGSLKLGTSSSDSMHRGYYFGQGWAISGSNAESIVLVTGTGSEIFMTVSRRNRKRCESVHLDADDDRSHSRHQALRYEQVAR